MAGHSQFANIKHRKAAVDAKRGKIWTKISKQIIVAAKMGGGDPVSNVRLRTAILDARAVSMPKDNIERAIKRGLGELDGGNVEEAIYEGYGPNGVAVMCDIMTDNRNRTAPEVRKIFETHGGQLGKTGCVAYLFERKGLFLVPTKSTSEEQLMEVALEAGAEDVKAQGENFEIVCAPENYVPLSEALENAKIEVASKQLTRIPSNVVEITDVDTAKQVIKLMEALDDHDDVQNVSANFNIPEEALAALNS